MACTAQDQECTTELHHDLGTARQSHPARIGGIDCKELKRTQVVSLAEQIGKDHGRAVGRPLAGA